MLDTLNHSDFVEMAVTLWAIWYARRRLIHDGEHQSPLSTYLFVRRFLEDLNQTLVPSCRQQIKAKSLDATNWIAPPQGFVKLNADAATSKNGDGVHFLWSAVAKMVLSWVPQP
jgi:hypothetical protein